MVHPLVLEFLRSHPEMDVQLMLLDRGTDLIADNVDLAPCVTDAATRLAARPLMRVRQLLRASPAYLAARGTPAHPMALSQPRLPVSG